MSGILESFGLILLLFTDFGDAAYCTKYLSYTNYFETYDYYTYKEYCPFGCCDNISDDPCCSAVGPVVGIVIAIACVLCSILICCCFCKKQPASQGQIMQPPHQTVIYTPVNQGQTGVVYPPPQLQPYQTPAAYPQSTQQPAYPAYPVGPQVGYQAPPAQYHPPPSQNTQYSTNLTQGYPAAAEQSKASAPPLADMPYMPPPSYSEVTQEKTPLP